MRPFFIMEKNQTPNYKQLEVVDNDYPQNNYEIDVQDLTDLYISKIDSIYLNKEKEILTV